MSDAGYEPPEGTAAPSHQDDDAPVQLGYGDGRVPVLIWIAWIVFIATYIGVMATVALPDLLAWMER